MSAGSHCGKQVVEADIDVARLNGSDEELMAEMEECVCPSFGACPSMGTANTMQLMGEVFNLVLPGTSCIPAADNLKIRKAREAGAYMVKMTKEQPRPSALITRETLLNAIKFDMAIAGSTNAVLHILSMSYELGLGITLEDFERCAKEIPCITGVIPSGPYTINDLYYAGGALAVMKMLEGKICKEVPTMTGTTWGELLSKVKAESSDVVRSLEHPLFTVPGLMVLRGNLSPNGAIIRPTGVPEEMKVFSGKAKVFDNDSKSLAAIERGEIVPGDVIVIRYEGCKGSPGMKEMMLTTDALVSYGLHKSVGLVTDARFSGFNYGAIVGHVSPEAYDGGNIALVEDGDIITVDTVRGEVTLEVPHITTIDLCEIYGPAKSPDADLKNITIFDGQIDRSPCGTGTSAKVAALWARGKLKLGDPFVYESVIGTKFTGRALRETKVGPYRAVVPEITGSAYITGHSQFLIDDEDPVKYGFSLG